MVALIRATARSPIRSALASFESYMSFVGAPCTRAQFEANMDAKMRDKAFLGDLGPLLRLGLDYDAREAWQTVHERIVSQLPGEPWKGVALE